jgi:hypothetical protein
MLWYIEIVGGKSQCVQVVFFNIPPSPILLKFKIAMMNLKIKLIFNQCISLSTKNGILS